LVPHIEPPLDGYDDMSVVHLEVLKQFFVKLERLHCAPKKQERKQSKCY